MPATPEHVGAVHAKIHKALRDLSPLPVPVLYGGSVSGDNALSLVREPAVEGLFIGRAAWQVENFAAIVEAVTLARASVEGPEEGSVVSL